MTAYQTYALAAAAKSIVAAAYQTTTEVAYRSIYSARERPACAHMRIGSWNGTGTLDATIYHGVEPAQDSTLAEWQQAFTFAQMSAESASEIQFWSTSRPLLPYLKIEAVLKETAGETLTVHGVIEKILTEPY